MDAKQLAEIKAREQAATPGPWGYECFGRYEDHDECILKTGTDECEISAKEDAEFIAYARTDITALVAEVERLNVLAEQRYQLYDGALTTIATLEKALELKCEDQSDVDRMISYAKQAQEVSS